MKFGLEIKDLIEIVLGLSGFVSTIAIIKRDVKSLRRDMNGLGSKVSKIDERTHDIRVDVALINGRMESDAKNVHG